jgi:hypothetical protein
MRYQLGSGNVIKGEGGLAGFKNALAAMRNNDWNQAANQMLGSKWFKKDTPERALRASEITRDGNLATKLGPVYGVPCNEHEVATKILGLPYTGKTRVNSPNQSKP